MWYSSFDNEPIGEDEYEAREAIVENMTGEDYLDFVQNDSYLIEKILRWCFNNGIFYNEFQDEIGDIEEQFFKENSYYAEEDED